MPSTAKFLHAVAKLPNGAVVLPGLDTDLDDEAWELIGGIRKDLFGFLTPPASNHQQYAMHALLDRFGVGRGDVEILGARAAGGREIRHVDKAFRPVECHRVDANAAGSHGESPLGRDGPDDNNT